METAPSSSVLAGVDPASVGVSDAIEAKEHLADLRRGGYGALLALILFPLFGLFDLLQTSYVGEGNLLRLLLLRSIPIPFSLALAIRLRRKPHMSRRAYEAWTTISMLTFGATLSLMCVETGGFTSLYAAGVLLATVGVFFMPTSFGRSMRTVWLTLITYPVVIFGSTFFVPAMHAQLHDPRALAVCAQFHLVGVVIGTFVAFLNAVFWSMRRELLRTRSVGRYRLSRLLAKGGMGEVWLAHHSGLRRDVALKILRSGTDEPDEVAARRFEVEVRATAELTHPNTVRVFDYGATDDGLLYYAMELLEGENLAELVAREGPLPAERAVHFLRQATRALAEAHARGIVHRDVKPENLFVTSVGGEGDFIKVLDFGIAKVVGGDAPENLTSTGMVAGTPYTMSPEVILGEQASPASDVYALGTVAYLLLTGSFPFSATVASATLVAHVNTAPIPPSRRTSITMSEELEAIVMQCLEKRPALRFSDAKTLAQALDGVPEAGRYRAPADTLPQSASQSRPRMSSPESKESETDPATTRRSMPPPATHTGPTPTRTARRSHS